MGINLKESFRNIRKEISFRFAVKFTPVDPQGGLPQSIEPRTTLDDSANYVGITKAGKPWKPDLSKKNNCNCLLFKLN